ncbi:hypothetical protein [Massilia sp. SYSU DXS3249]
MQFSQLARRAGAAFVISCAVQPVLAQVAATGAPQEVKGWRAETVTDALPQAWGMAWLPDGRILVTGKEGTLHLVAGGKVQPVPPAHPAHRAGQVLRHLRAGAGGFPGYSGQRRRMR